MKLTDFECQQALWLKLVEHINQAIEKLRRKNDNASLGEIETARLRGQVAALKELLDLGQPEPAISAEYGDE